MKKRLLSWVLMAIILISLASRSGWFEDTAVDVPRQGVKPTVAVTIVPQQSFVEAIAGGLVDVVVLVPPGYSPGNYEPTPAQMARLSEASLYFTMGTPTERANILHRIPDLNPQLQVICSHAMVEATYPPRYLTDDHHCDHPHEHEAQQRDPHIWLSPRRVQIMVQRYADELSSLDPDYAETYQANAKAYIADLDDLDAYIVRALAHLENRSFIVYHPAFGYFADDYGLEMIALEQDGKEATPQSLKYVIDLARQQGVKVVFYQAEIDSRQSRAMAEQIGGRVQKLEPLAPDYIANLKRITDIFANSVDPPAVDLPLD